MFCEICNNYRGLTQISKDNNFIQMQETYLLVRLSHACCYYSCGSEHRLCRSLYFDGNQ